MKDPNDGMNKNIFFYNCISSLGILSLAGPFIVVCCTATVSLPIHRFLADSHQRRIFLPITPLQPPQRNKLPVFTNKLIVKMLVDDMGGHEHALEALEESIKGKNLENINFIDLINNIRARLIDHYS